MRRLIREPLLHFLLAGALLFALYGTVAGDDDRPDRIVISEARVSNLAESFARVWMRPPTAEELSGLVDEYLREEVLYREAVALGLDQNDLIVRRRMRQKMEFLNEDLASAQEPTDAELQALLDAKPEIFQEPAQTSFEQVFVSRERSGSPADEQALVLLERLQGDPDPEEAASLGDATLLPRVLEQATAREVAGTFGSDFSDALANAPVGTWTGPLESSFGLHLVRITERTAAQAPGLADVRDRVAREWAAERRTEANERFYRALRNRYEVEVRMPADSTPPPLAANAP
jgi:hypothetical protein